MKFIVDKIIEFSVRNRFLVVLMVMVIALGGAYCLYRTPVDAIPDLSENQVIVWADWPGRSPKEIEDQITYPLSVNLQGLAGVKSIRATSEFGFSMINIIFEEKMDFYFTRQRVLERLSIAGSFLPPEVVPYLAPDATALGQIFWYTVEGEGKSLDELRTIEDWYVRYQLNSVSGVAQVASVGGFVREYQIDVDPTLLRAYDVSLGEVFRAVAASNSSVGGKVIHKGGAEYLVRGYGWIRNEEDLRDVVVVERNGVPITVDRLGTVQLGPAFRRSVLEKGGREAVGGVVMMRYGENPRSVTEAIKDKIAKLQVGLPEGVRIVPFYDRTGLIDSSIDTLSHTLVEEIIVTCLVVFIVLWPLRSGIVICLTLPLAILIAFIFMYFLGIPSNIMSLSGIAISIGVLVDSGIVMTENAYNRLYEHFKGGKVVGDTRELVIEACKVVGGPLFFSILIMLLSFLPVFVLGGMEGKMFNPLAYTKSFALFGVSLLAITLVPALVPTFVRGRLRSQEEVWVVRSFVQVYRPMLDYFMRHPDVIVVITGVFLLVGLPVFPKKVPWVFFVALVPFLLAVTVCLIARRKVVCLGILLVSALLSFHFLHPLGEEFMPPLDELAIMDMPTSTPNINITQAGDDIKARDTIIRSFPEVHQVVGKVGRAETPTDPAPVDMVETVVSLRPKTWWPRRKVNYDEVVAEGRVLRDMLLSRGLLRSLGGVEDEDLLSTAVMEASSQFDRAARELSERRLREYAPQRARELIRMLRSKVVEFLRAKGSLAQDPSEARWTAVEDELAGQYGPILDEWILLDDVKRVTQRVVDFLVAEKLVEKSGDLLAEPAAPLDPLFDALRHFAGKERPSLVQRFRDALEQREEELMVARLKQLDWELQDRAPAMLDGAILEALGATARERKALAKEMDAEALGAELRKIGSERAPELAKGLFLWKKLKPDLVKEMDSELQFPGWGNIWTQPIINRVDMLATGVRTMIGVKIFGSPLGVSSGEGVDAQEQLQTAANQIGAVLKGIHGAVDVFPDQIVGENYLEISIDRKRSARYGVNVQDIQDAIEVALGGKEITMTVEGRSRFPVRVRYPRDMRVDEEAVRNILIPVGGAGGGMSAASSGGMGMVPATPAAPKEAAPSRLSQIPLSLVADVKIVRGPSMIKSENGLPRAYVQLNVRDRDIVGFVEEAKRAVESQVKLPSGFYIEWSGQFEHQVRAQRTLMLVFPLVVLIIFMILYMTYGDLPDTFMMFLSVPGAVAGGAIFQYIWGYNFSVAVQIGYIICFGLATETGIVMLVYLREAIEKRQKAGLLNTEQDIHDAVIEGAVHRLRPKLLTEGTTIIGLVPMLWSTGVGAEFMRPMAAPILGGILVADEVVDILIPVLFYWDRCRRLRKGLLAAPAPKPTTP